MKFLQKAVYWILVRSGLYAWWSRLYQRLWDRRYVGKVLDAGHLNWRGTLTPEGAADLVRLIPYHRDGFKEVHDAFHHPVAGDYLLGRILAHPDNRWAPRDLARIQEQGYPEIQDLVRCRVRYNHGESWDCDDAALWCAWAVRSGHSTRVLNIVWSTGRWPWKVQGHNVCICRQGDQFVHIGNWGYRGPFISMDEVVNDILGCVGKTVGDLVGRHVMSREQLTAKF